jgi:hypothetical protein
VAAAVLVVVTVLVVLVTRPSPAPVVQGGSTASSGGAQSTAASTTDSAAASAAETPTGTGSPAAVTSPLPPPHADAGLAQGGGPFGPSNFWRSTVTDAPVADNSAAMVSNLAQQVAGVYGGVAAFNAYRYNVSFYTVNAGVPRRDVIWDDCQQKGAEPAGLAEQFAQVPIPDDAVPSTGTDSSLSIYSPSLDAVWEFWVTHHAADGWHACWGGRIDNVSTTAEPFFHDGFGAAATGLASFGGAVSLADVKAGEINHVVALNVISAARYDYFSWPAQRSDGDREVTPDVIPEGQRFRLDPRLDVSRMHLTPLAAMIARAAQKYGFVVTDKAGAVTVIGESGAGIAAQTGVNPWDSLLAGTPDYLQLKDFPWDKLQAMPRDYGKP